MPGFGVKYNLPIEDMQKLNLPVVNIDLLERMPISSQKGWKKTIPLI